MNPLISVRGLRAAYGDSVILKDIDLDIKPNEVAVILGSSGSGKTTLLKNILRLEQPTAGSVKYRGEELTDMDEARYREILIRFGVLFQSGALLNSLSVFDNLAIPLEQHSRLSLRVIERVIRAKLNLVRLDGAMYQLPSELSGGMRKRAALARAIALDPEILFCDEPTSGLDPLNARALDELLLDLKTQLNMTIVVVTHELASIQRLADRIFFLEDGALIFSGTLTEALSAGIPPIDRFFEAGRFD
ncbi:MAG: ATP-binding cassette domain-containing protein [Candidatus Cloacimonetes bacterium]|jgi:phospholipid/cholesterol/gamma-HCH transport system ATP-binding protein|nr:ATP-binding cassette domain-containing protein [Candidatus Cloacimonadota bacterium]MDD3142926.1 ATP-binding cassette domain-containing protein [Candidatus Cloacimonadota bacterium]MDY0367818.1 ATP-binding cassette domain-containing protein [Candidatus Syntrophosphaera sp.]HOY83935.1 ATP-binding cassette domain-containing protein [Candidatus Syntrophosphaera sp.]HPH60313.1 ATP-binding cassette domain-containing protein [Candidatus Syntrophosphaera sp.]